MRTGFGQTTLAGEVIKVTDSAVLFVTDDGTETWIPRSVCLQGEDIDEGDTDVCVADWFPEREGLS